MKGKDMRFVLLLDFYGPMLTERQQEAMEYYYDEDLSLAEIAQHTQITRQGVRDLIKRSEAALLEMEERLGFLKRFEEMRVEVRKIKSASAEIGEINQNRFFSPQVRELVSEIDRLADRVLE